jgi:hypothetical protein
MSGWRIVKVFLSSTFRDMHAERDHLIKVTFPALREKLLPHRSSNSVTLTPGNCCTNGNRCCVSCETWPGTQP